MLDHSNSMAVSAAIGVMEHWNITPIKVKRVQTLCYLSESTEVQYV